MREMIFMREMISTLLLALSLVLSLAACGGSAPPAQPDIDLADFCADVQENYEWPVLMSLTEDESLRKMLDSNYPGLSDISTKQCEVYMAAMSAVVGEIALVEVEDSEDVKAVEGIFQARIAYQVGDETNPGGAWYPASIEDWGKDSCIASNGNYVMLAVGDHSAEAAADFNALFA